MTGLDYNDKLAQDIDVIRDKVERGMLPLVARNPALEKVTRDYALSQAELYEKRRAAGEKPPIPFRDERLLGRCADLVMYEELTWSHPDKMSIVEYPVMSEDQEEGRRAKYTPHDDLKYGDMRYLGRKKTHFTDENGAPQVRNSRVINPNDDDIERSADSLLLREALIHAGLTERQRQAIDLVFFEDMTQEAAAREMGVGQDVVSRHMSAGLRKLREFMTKT